MRKLLMGIAILALVALVFSDVGPKPPGLYDYRACTNKMNLIQGLVPTLGLACFVIALGVYAVSLTTFFPQIATHKRFLQQRIVLALVVIGAIMALVAFIPQQSWYGVFCGKEPTL